MSIFNILQNLFIYNNGITSILDSNCVQISIQVAY
jgi:hypothetical protein